MTLPIPHKPKKILDHWQQEKQTFIKVYPRDYHRMQDLIAHYTQPGVSKEQAVQKAFDVATKKS